MALFVQYALSFPTIIYSLFLIVTLCFWLISLLGLFNPDTLTAERSDVDSEVDIGGLSSILNRYQLNGIPILVTLTLFSLLAWLISYFTQHLLLSEMALGFLGYVIGFVLFLVIGYLSLFLTSWLLRPVKLALSKLNNTLPAENQLIGRQAVVSSTRVTQQFGEAYLDEEGRRLILKIRAPESLQLTSGDRVVLLDYDANERAYQVVSEEEFRDI